MVSWARHWDDRSIRCTCGHTAPAHTGGTPGGDSPADSHCRACDCPAWQAPPPAWWTRTAQPR